MAKKSESSTEKQRYSIQAVGIMAAESGAKKIENINSGTSIRKDAIKINTRTRQKIKAELRREYPDVLATLKAEEKDFLKVLFIPRDKVQTYKEEYGDNIEFWNLKEEQA